MIEQIERALRAYLTPTRPPVLGEAMDYSLFAGGKRLRPLIIIAACTGFGKAWETAMPFACAAEMIHTYSLIHDDLPALDNDDYRRGLLSNHMIFGDAMAILAGDALLNRAYEIMCDDCAKYASHMPAMQAITHAVGSYGMIAGQVEDILAENKSISEDTLIYIHANKTAAFIRACFVAGGVLGEADEHSLAKLGELGEKLGMAFQIRDDYLDVTKNTAELGKPANSDIRNNKATYVTLFGKDRAKSDANALTEQALKEIDTLPLANDALAKIAAQFYVDL